MTHSNTKQNVVPSFFLDIQCPVFQRDDKNMLAMENIQVASVLHDCACSFDILLSIPQFTLFLPYINSACFILQ
jgi:hypothetical protein